MVGDKKGFVAMLPGPKIPSPLGPIEVEDRCYLRRTKNPFGPLIITEIRKISDLLPDRANCAYLRNFDQPGGEGYSSSFT